MFQGLMGAMGGASGGGMDIGGFLAKKGKPSESDHPQGRPVGDGQTLAQMMKFLGVGQQQKAFNPYQRQEWQNPLATQPSEWSVPDQVRYAKTGQRPPTAGLLNHYFNQSMLPKPYSGGLSDGEAWEIGKTRGSR